MSSSTANSEDESSATTVGKNYLCINCNKDCRGIIGSSTELKVNHPLDQFRTITVLEALAYTYDFSWDIFISDCGSDILEKYRDENVSSDLSPLAADILKSVQLCGQCSPLLAEYFKYRKCLESFCSSESLLFKAKEFCQVCKVCSEKGTQNERSVIETEENGQADDDGDQFSDDDNLTSAFYDGYESNSEQNISIKNETHTELAEHVDENFDTYVSLQKLPTDVLEAYKQKGGVHSAKKKSSKTNGKADKESSKNVKTSTSSRAKRKEGKVTTKDELSGLEKKNGLKTKEVNPKIVKIESLGSEKSTQKNNNKRKRPSKPLPVNTSKKDLKDTPTKSMKKETLKTNPPESRKMKETIERPCNKCDQVFPSFRSLQRHRATHLAWKRKGPYSCDQCSQTFSVLHLYRSHKMSHKKPKKPKHVGPYPCDHCDAICSSYEGYKYKHMNLHMENPKIVCDICGKSLSRNAIRVHKKLMHPELEGVQKSALHVKCEVCGKSMLKACLKKHMELHSTERKLYQCDQCDKSYLSKSKWQFHVKSHLLDEESFKCPFCDKICANEFALAKHKALHTKSKSFACDKCNKTFRENYSLVRHQVTHETERPYACEECGKTFKSAEYLTLHQKNTHKKKAQSLYKEEEDKDEEAILHQCPMCPKTFRTEKGLLRHQPYHETTMIVPN